MGITTSKEKLLRALEASKYGYLEVSSGTLRTYDLFHTFRNELKRWAPRGYITKKRLGFFFVPRSAKYDDRHKFWDTEDAAILVDQMRDALDHLAPEDWYFGTNEGDNSCFGWWRVQEADWLPPDDFEPEV